MKKNIFFVLILFIWFLYNYQNTFASSLTFSISCIDEDSWCRDWFDVKTPWTNYFTKINNNVYTISSSGKYIFKIFDNAWNYSTIEKTVALYDWELIYTDSNYKEVSLDWNKTSNNEVKDKDWNWISDSIQCYLENKTTSCDNTDTIEPNGTVLFNWIEWTYSNWEFVSNVCSKTDIEIKAKCSSDTAPNWVAPSWCNSSFSDNIQEIQTISNNLINDFWIIDNAWNLKILHYKLNNIDRTPPIYNDWNNSTHSENLKWNLLVLNNWYAWNNNISFSLYDEYPSWCYFSNLINYSIWLSWPDWDIIYNWNTSTADTFSETTQNGWLMTYYTKYNITKSLNITKAWDYYLKYIKFIDSAWNEWRKDFNNHFYISPSNPDESNSNLLLLNSLNSKYANNNDYYEYSLYLKDYYNNPIINKSIYKIEQDPLNTILTDSDITWNKAIKENIIWTTDSNWLIKFKIRSLAPWYFAQKFEITLNKWQTNYSNINNQFYTINKEVSWINSFLKPFTSAIKVVDDNWWLNWIPKIWTSQSYFIKLINNWSITNVTNGYLNINENTISNKVQWHLWEIFDNIVNTFNSDYLDNLWFNARINATSNYLEAPLIESNWLYISYNFWWEYIKYFINWNTTPQTTTSISIIWNKQATLWVKVLWISQNTWKADLTWQIKNFSDLSKSTQRNDIRKNAILLVKWMKSWDISNGVKYVEWDNITINWNLQYETLVVKNWNIIISWDINRDWKKLWIIVLKDWYDINYDFNKFWNIYIKPNVLFINASIYADWWIISADTYWNPYLYDTSDRTNNLINQLVIKWSIFTRNTIGWAILWPTWIYKLPWWQNTIDFNKAMIYDLNYVRRSNKLANISLNLWNLDNFVIIYNPSIQTNPPKGFSSN